MKCGLCQQDVPKLAKSHVIAKAIATHGRPKGSREPLVILSSDKGHRVVRSQTGIYSKIVCAKCEAGFQAADDALIELCRSLGQGVPIQYDGSRFLAVEYPNADIGAVHRGVLTTLFRAHLSPHPSFQHVVLDPVLEQRIRELLLSDASTLSSEFAVVLRVVLSEQGLASMSPFRTSMGGVQVIQLYFPNLTAYVKLDDHFDEVFQGAAIGALPHLHAVLKEQLSVSEMDFFRHVTEGRDSDIARFSPKPKD